MTALLYLPPPDPYAGADPCPACRGAGVTGNQYRIQDGNGLLVDEFCQTCDGCGRQQHDGCDPRAHAQWELSGKQLDYDGLPVDEQACPSCQGRTWWPLKVFPVDCGLIVRRYLRVPCGCAESSLTTVERA